MVNPTLAIDFEGSHKNPRVGCPIQIGIALMDGEQVLESWESLIQVPKHFRSGKPTREVDAYALKVSGLTLDDLENAPTCREVCAHLVSRIKAWQSKHSFSVDDVPNVAFNIGYDFEAYCDLLFQGGEYDRQLAEYVGFRAILGHKWECAAQMARRKLNLYSYSLDSVALFYGLERSSEHHGALEDAILAGRVHHRLANREVASVG